MSGTRPDVEDTATNKTDKVSSLKSLKFFWGKAAKKYIPDTNILESAQFGVRF